MRLHRVGIAMVTIAALAVGAGSAHAGSGPAPGASKGKGAAAPSAQRAAKPSTQPSAVGNPMSVRAQASGVCSDAYQIGKTTTFASDDSITPAVSLKQFYSPTCQRNYGYLWVWQAWRDRHPDPYEVLIGVYDEDTRSVMGQVDVKDTRQQEFWSQGTATVQDCTRADGHFLTTGQSSYTQTDLRC